MKHESTTITVSRENLDWLKKMKHVLEKESINAVLDHIKKEVNYERKTAA